MLYFHAFVVMPDHWHAMTSLRASIPLEDIVQRICRRASYPSRHRAQDLLWQDGFHDHKVRRGESVVELVRYIENNPFRQELVEQAGEWHWSSACSEYQGNLDRSFLGSERWKS